MRLRSYFAADEQPVLEVSDNGLGMNLNDAHNPVFQLFSPSGKGRRLATSLGKREVNTRSMSSARVAAGARTRKTVAG